MQELIDISGKTFNYLEVLSFSHIDKRRRSYWNCICTRCGTEVTLRKDAFAYSYSKTKSCGCWKPDESRIRINKNRDKVTGRVLSANGGY